MANEKQEQVETTLETTEEVEAKTVEETVEIDLDALVAQMESGVLEVKFSDEEDAVNDVKSEDEEETDEKAEETEVEVKDDAQTDSLEETLDETETKDDDELEVEVEENDEEIEVKTEDEEVEEKTGESEEVDEVVEVEEKAEGDEEVEEKAETEETEVKDDEEEVEEKASPEGLETTDVTEDSEVPETQNDERKDALVAEMSELAELVAEVEENNDDVEDIEVKDENEEVETKVIELNEFEIKRLTSMGMDETEIKELPSDSFVCSVERKALQAPCDFCRGGCASEDGLPSLLEVEGRAEKDAGGIVVGSGYEPTHDVFIVDVKRESEEDLVELVYTGAGELWQWKKLEVEGEIDEKALQSTAIVSMADAQDIALKSFNGISVGVYPDRFQGELDVYVVEIEGKDGKDVDVYVDLSGEVVAYDEYADDRVEDDPEIKALEDEIAGARAALELKRMFTAERRAELAEEGDALPDGSFPIVNEGDLRNAVQAAGRAKYQEKVKRHIKKRARELDRTDLLPDAWKSEHSVVVDNEDDPSLAEQIAEFEALAAELGE